jgi:hypothetical protein
MLEMSSNVQKTLKDALSLVDLIGISLVLEPSSDGWAQMIKGAPTPSIPIDIDAIEQIEFYLLHGKIC